jgi:hemoglobin
MAYQQATEQGPQVTNDPGTIIDERLIQKLIRRFYDNVRQDAVLGPIFAQRIDDWELHLQRMFSFWSSVVLATGRYHGQPMHKHARLPIDARHFDRWLNLFENTTREVCTPAVAVVFMDRARRIATSLEMGRADAQGVLLGRGERFVDASLC